MKKFLLVAVFALYSALNIFSQGFTVVVAPFDVRGGFSVSDADTINELFLTELAKHKNIKVVDQSQNAFKTIIDRMQFELSDWSDTNKVTQFGKALNANAVVLGQMMMLGNQRIITVRILDVRTTQILAPNRMEINNVGEILGKLPAFTTELVNNLVPPPPPANPFDGRWRATYTSWDSEQTMFCILNFRSDGTITVERYDTNKVTRTYFGKRFHDKDEIKRGRGRGTYSYRESGNGLIMDISLTITGVSHEFVAVTAQGTFYSNNPNVLYMDGMYCESWSDSGLSDDAYKIFSRM